jgi:hypothetical protein
MKTLLTVVLTVLTATLADAQSPPPLSVDDKAVEDALVAAGVGSREAIRAQMVWEHCTQSAVDRFSAQSETARTVAEAAMAACITEEGRYMVTSGIQFPASIEDTSMPALIARVMSNRAAKLAPLPPPLGK